MNNAWEQLERVGTCIAEGRSSFILVEGWQSPLDVGQPLPSSTAAGRIAEWAHDHRFRRDILRLAVQLGLRQHATMDPVTHIESARRIVQLAVESGTLLVFELARTHAPAQPAPASEADPSAPDDTRPSPDPPVEKTWIEVRLVDTDGRPVAGARYRITLPNHETREGILDAFGIARLSGIDAGSCDVSFPEIHAAEWKAA